MALYPVMPTTAEKMAAALGVDAAPNLLTQSSWGLLAEGTAIHQGSALFPRLKKKGSPEKQHTKSKKQKANKPEAKEQKGDDGLISFDRFKEIDLRVAEIIAAEKIAKSDRLLKLTVKAPEERTIVAGIAESYTPDELVGKQVIIAANLKPAKLMGVTSHGMVLAAKEGDRLIVSTVSGLVTPGSKVA